MKVKRFEKEEGIHGDRPRSSLRIWKSVSPIITTSLKLTERVLPVRRLVVSEVPYMNVGRQARVPHEHVYDSKPHHAIITRTRPTFHVLTSQISIVTPTPSKKGSTAIEHDPSSKPYSIAEALNSVFNIPEVTKVASIALANAINPWKILSTIHTLPEKRDRLRVRAMRATIEEAKAKLAEYAEAWKKFTGDPMIVIVMAEDEMRFEMHEEGETEVDVKVWIVKDEEGKYEMGEDCGKWWL